MLMNTNMKSKSTTTDAADKVREIAEAGTEQTRQGFEKISTATKDAADLMRDCCSTAVKGFQDYNSKLAQFAQDNTRAHLEFLQKLASVRSPAELIEFSTDQATRQLETIAEQTKHLTQLAQEVALATAEPLKTGFSKALDRAA